MGLSTGGGQCKILDKTMRNSSEIDEYLNIISAFPFVSDTYVEGIPLLFDGHRGQYDGFVIIKINNSPTRFRFIQKNFSKYSIIRNLIHNLEISGTCKELFILFSEYITAEMANYLDSEGINFIDLAGNCRFVLGNEIYVFRTGNTPVKTAEPPRGISRQALSIIFALLVDPKIVNLSVREIAFKAGVSKSTVANWLYSFENEGIIGKTKQGFGIIEKEALWKRWFEGYPTVVLPEIFIGTYMTPYDDPLERDKRITSILNKYDREWAMGGLTASWKFVKHYKGENSTFHISKVSHEFLREIKAIPSKDGHLTLLEPMGLIAMRSELPHVAHPLLVYTQLITSGDNRAMESAQLIFEKYLMDFSDGY